MSTTHVSAALDASADITPTERLVLIELAHVADGEGSAFASVSRLARGANVSLSSATRSLRRLSEAHLVQHVRHDSAASGFSVFRVTLDSNCTEETQA